jgi:Tfp pilus assembly protein PilN
VIAGLNLASHPFRNRTLPWASAVVFTLASLLTLFYAVTEGGKARAQADSTERAVTGLRAERRAIEERAAAVRQEMPRDQLDVLSAAHALVDRKTFSWSQLFADLEAAMPESVRVQRINVRDVAQRNGMTRAELEMTVVGRTTDDLNTMVNEMNRHGSFSATPVSQQFKSERGESGYELMLRVSYTQRARARDENREGGGVVSSLGAGHSEARE